MRFIAVIRGHRALKRAMLCDADEGCYIFLYDKNADGPCTYDYFENDMASAKLRCLEDYGIADADWREIPDLIPGCQQDWINPVRVVGRSVGGPKWGQFERLEDGRWICVPAEQTDEREPE